MQAPELTEITVAMATFNGAPYIREQIDSILSQTLPPRNIIICDDGSTDGTVEILKSYEARGLISLEVNDARLGYIGNFKKAVSLSNPAHYVALSDQDDIWLPGKLEAAAAHLLSIETPDRPAMVYSDLILVDEEKNVVNNSFSNELKQDTYRHCLETLLFGGFVNGCTILMNSQMAAFFDTIPESGAAEHDSWIALIGHSFGDVGRVPEPHILYRRHVRNATGLINHKQRNRLGRLLDEIRNLFRGQELFKKELDTAAEFYEAFQERLTPQQSKLFQRFLSMKDKGYLERKIMLRSFFRGKWA